jgi:hypothetical protein
MLAPRLPSLQNHKKIILDLYKLPSLKYSITKQHKMHVKIGKKLNKAYNYLILLHNCQYRGSDIVL